MLEGFAVLIAWIALAGCWGWGEGGAFPYNRDDAGPRGRDMDAAANGGHTPDGERDADRIVDGGEDADTDAAADDAGDPGIEGRWRFAVTGDSRDVSWGFNEEVFPRIVEAVVNEHDRSAIDLIVFTGDMVYGTTDVRAELLLWRRAMQPVYDRDIAVYPVRGNHELSCNAACWQVVFSRSYALPENGPEGEIGLTYSVAHKNALFIGFDNYSGDLVNLSWVRGELLANTRPHVFAFSHEPAFAASHTDCLDDLPEQRDQFWESLERAGARVYFCGHDHFFDHARVDDRDGDPNNDIHQFIVGSAGGPFHSFSPPYPGDNSSMTVEQVAHDEAYGFVLVEVDNLEVTLTWMPLEGGAGASWGYRLSS